MNRRKALGAVAALATLPLVECAARADDVKVERVVSKVAKNHGHALVVSPADVKAGVARTYDLTGTSGHLHEVTLTADDFKKLAAGEPVRMPSTRFDGRGHRHRVLLRAAPAVDPPGSAAVCEVIFSGQDDHELVVTAGDIAARADKTYDIQGIADHVHTLTIAAADFEKLAAGTEVKVRTTVGSDDGHTHLVFVRHPQKKP
jgi:hypothetical protein